jgi:phospholipid-binding lipoprotein MlaA
MTANRYRWSSAIPSVFLALVAVVLFVPLALAGSPSGSPEGEESGVLTVAAARIKTRMEANRLLIAFADCGDESGIIASGFLYDSGFEQESGVSDSVEGFNRVMFVCNDVLILYLFRPIMKGYFVLTPWCVRKGIDNAARNIEFPIRAVSCLLQARWSDAGIVCLRFLINTVLGVAGIYDFAAGVWDIRERDEDTGQAFAVWGIGPGAYLYLPIMGPSSVRDGVGAIFDFALDPKTYAPIPGVQSFATFNRASFLLDDYVKLVQSYADPYHVLKTMWLIQRRVKTNVEK